MEPTGPVESDVLVVGGGVAGCVAAIRAREAGASVVIVDKTRDLRRTGDAGHGVAFLTAYLDSGPSWDTPEAFAEWYCDSADGLVDMEVAAEVAVAPLPACLELLEACRVPLRDPATGDHVRVQRMWTPGPIVVRFDGSDLKPRLTERALELGARVVGGVHVSSVLVGDGGVTGAVGFGIRGGEHHVFRAPAVVVAAGNAERVMYNSPRRDPFNTYHRPYHGATGFALAARAGARAASLEFLGSFLFPRGFATGAMGNLLEAGGRLVNAEGQLVAELATRPGEREFGFGIVGQAAREVIAGRGPLFLDCTGLSRAQLDDVMSYVSFDAPLFEQFLAQSDIDLRQDLLEMEFFTGTWSATCSPKGIVIDSRCEAGVPGLFVAGDLATPAYALAGALSTGHVAGRAAAEHARNVGRVTPDPDALAAEHERLAAPLRRRTGPTWREFERELQDTMTRYVGLSRNARGLEQALACLAGFADAAENLRVANGHELVRAQEAIDLHLFDQMMALAALERDESRFGFLMGHFRSDHPVADDARWKGVATIVDHDGSAPGVSRRVFNPSWRDARLVAAGGG
jgi:adenylylsulfate reductase subunit A